MWCSGIDAQTHEKQNISPHHLQSLDEWSHEQLQKQ